MRRRRSASLLMMANLIEVLFPLTSVRQSHMSPHACGTQLAAAFTIADMLTIADIADIP